MVDWRGIPEHQEYKSGNYSPRTIKKSGSIGLALATIAILGQGSWYIHSDSIVVLKISGYFEKI
ncbi:MAG: hypothetical protein ACRER2_10025 [Methylococcales bacterium]